MHLVRSTLFLIGMAVPCSGDTVLQETWQTGYQGKDANGAHVIGYWKFDPGAELKDQSRHQRQLVLNGAGIHPEGRSGGGLKCGFSPKKPHSARLDGNDLSPAGAF